MLMDEIKIVPIYDEWNYLNGLFWKIKAYNYT